jgi:putative hydrolase of the HAD superfamily
MTDGKDKPSLAPFEHPDVWVFDLDNTLYPAGHELFQQIDLNMKTFISDLLEVDRDEAHRIQKDYFHTHGTTLRGLMNAHGIEPGPYLDFVHDIDLSDLPASPKMNEALGALDGRKIIFTNASLEYAERVLDQLRIRHHFEDVFDIVAADYLPKPNISPYKKLIGQYQIDPTRAAMFEDMSVNLAPARELGMTTVWVPRDPEAARADGPDDHVDHVVDDLAHWLHALSQPAA